jgi:tetratricopeptide (TPR) repeat protein
MMENYDNHKYPPAMKNCEAVLAAHPEHAETLAFRALVLNALKRKEEAYEAAKAAVAKNMKNVTCWHA